MSAEPKEQLTVPFVYGSIAFPLSKKMEDYTHKWICYLRGIDGENLSYLISKVVFHLHPSCGNPNREITAFPFEIQQMGWGEFEIQLDVHLTLPGYPIVNLVHQLKVAIIGMQLHHTHTGSSQVSKKPLCSEAYDEFVFPNPDTKLMQLLKDRDHGGKQSSDMDEELAPESEDTFNPDLPLKTVMTYSRYFMKFEPQEHKARLDEAIKFVNNEIQLLLDRMKVLDGDVHRNYEELSRM